MGQVESRQNPAGEELKLVVQGEFFGRLVGNPEVIRSRHHEISTGQSALLRLTNAMVRHRFARRSEVVRMAHAFRLVLTSPTGRKRSADQTSSIAMMETGRHPVPLIASEMRSRLRSLSIPDVFFG